MNFGLGQVVLVKELQTKNGFDRFAQRGTFRANRHHLSAMLYLGEVNADTLPQFSPNGAMASLGYGPLLLSRTQVSLLDVIDKLRDRLAQQQEVSDEDQALIDLADGAIAACAAFTTAAAPQKGVKP